MFKNISVNTLLVDILLDIPGYANSMKDFVIKRWSMDFETVKISHHCRIMCSWSKHKPNAIGNIQEAWARSSNANHH